MGAVLFPSVSLLQHIPPPMHTLQRGTRGAPAPANLPPARRASPPMQGLSLSFAHSARSSVYTSGISPSWTFPSLHHSRGPASRTPPPPRVVALLLGPTVVSFGPG